MQPRTNPILRLARADMVFYLMPPLMALLVAGTVFQRPMGLYAAHKMFFASFVFWAGPVPLPGGYTLMGLLTLSLAIKFLFRSEWSRSKAGIILAHLGVLVLLGGGLMTAVFAREGFMILAESQQSPYVYDYNKRELSVFMGENASMTVPFSTLKPGYRLQGLPFTVQVLSACANCGIIKREDAAGGGSNDMEPRAMARFMALEAKKPGKAPEESLAGLTFRVNGAGAAQDGLYIAFDAMPKPVEITQDGRTYKIILGRSQRPLPFSLRLESFHKDSYPGTDMARAYRSDITVEDGPVSWPVRIEMNAPLRYKGYTFYQSSFEQTDKGRLSILSVVENRGRLFPYTGTALVAAGLLLHLFITFRTRRTA